MNEETSQQIFNRGKVAAFTEVLALLEEFDPRPVPLALRVLVERMKREAEKTLLVLGNIRGGGSPEPPGALCFGGACHLPSRKGTRHDHGEHEQTW